MLLHEIKNPTNTFDFKEKDRFERLMNTDRKDMSEADLEWYTTQLQKSNYNSEVNKNEKRMPS